MKIAVPPTAFRNCTLLILFALASWLGRPPACAGDDGMGSRWAVMVVGLPGDEEHQHAYQSVERVWRQWLTEHAAFPAEQVLLLSSLQVDGDNPGDTRAPATKESLDAAFTKLQQQIREDDSLWVFVLGHGNYDGERAYLHVPGDDPSDAELAAYLEPIRCREQVVWLTHSCSGWFLSRLSRPGRIVIAATAADFEVNATEFPLALADVMQRWPMAVDENHDRSATVLELFVAAARATEQRFTTDQRLPTEHAQLDDNGDGRGSELKALLAPMPTDSAATNASANNNLAPPAASAEQRDGQLATKTIITMLPAPEEPRPATEPSIGDPP